SSQRRSAARAWRRALTSTLENTLSQAAATNARSAASSAAVQCARNVLRSTTSLARVGASRGTPARWRPAGRRQVAPTSAAVALRLLLSAVTVICAQSAPRAVEDHQGKLASVLRLATDNG